MQLEGCAGVEERGCFQEIMGLAGEERRIYQTVQNPEENSAPCFYLVDNSCSLHDSGKPLLCEVWPTGPHDIIRFPACGYTFSVINEWPIFAADG